MRYTRQNYLQYNIAKLVVEKIIHFLNIKFINIVNPRYNN